MFEKKFGDKEPTQEAHEFDEVTPDFVRETVTPLLQEGEELTDDDVAIIITKANESLASGSDDIAESIQSAAGARFAAKRMVETDEGTLVVDVHDEVVGRATDKGEAHKLVDEERANQ